MKVMRYKLPFKILEHMDNQNANDGYQYKHGGKIVESKEL